MKCLLCPSDTVRGTCYCTSCLAKFSPVPKVGTTGKDINTPSERSIQTVIYYVLFGYTTESGKIACKPFELNSFVISAFQRMIANYVNRHINYIEIRRLSKSDYLYKCRCAIQFTIDKYTPEYWQDFTKEYPTFSYEMFLGIIKGISHLVFTIELPHSLLRKIKAYTIKWKHVTKPVTKKSTKIDHKLQSGIIEYKEITIKETVNIQKIHVRSEQQEIATHNGRMTPGIANMLANNEAQLAFDVIHTFSGNTKLVYNDGSPENVPTILWIFENEQISLLTALKRYIMLAKEF